MTRLVLLLSLATTALCTNFDWEKVQLNTIETTSYADISFGSTSGPNSTYTGPTCKVGPGDPGWPTVDEWSKFNATLGGALLKPPPAASVCYPGEFYDAAKCDFITSGNRTRYFLDNPVSILTDWAAGSTCVVMKHPNRTCTQGGYPVYVVNASTVRHIQMAVNFARNRNLRLVIKNAGHDFGGRSAGAGALSIWTHNLKEFEYLSEFTSGSYTGRAARVSAGVETWEIANYMGRYNTTMVTPGGDTVGVVGGFIAGGGHHLLSSIYGNGADQVLEFTVVTADGRYRTATPYQNSDLFFAMLGGGGSTYGVLTSAIIKAYPPTPVMEFDIVFEYGSRNFSLPGNFSLGSNGTVPRFPPTNGTFPQPGNFSIPRGNRPVVLNSSETFWTGVYLYQRFSPVVVDAGGTLYSYVRPLDGGGLNFSVIVKLPNRNATEALRIIAPLFTDLNRVGIPVVGRPMPSSEADTKTVRTGAWNPPGNTKFASRFFPRVNWDNATIYNETFAAIRASVEAGFTFHGVDHYAPYEVAGYPGNHTAINPIWRSSIMHADFFDYGFKGFATTDSQTFWERHRKLRGVMDRIKAVTPTGGAYFNEGDVLEPEWQRTFFGGYYPRLAQIKRARDPWGLFWAPTTPGSEAWRVVTVDDLPTQNGPLCRTGWVYEEGE